MNKSEICGKCPTQCELDIATQKLINLPSEEKPTTTPEIHAAVSRMLLYVKTRRQCPSEEIGRVKHDVTKGLNPNLARMQGIYIAPRVPYDPVTDYLTAKSKAIASRNRS